MNEDEYCFTCGGNHPTETHDTGRVIRIPTKPKRGPEDLDATIPWDAPVPPRQDGK